MKKRLHKFFAIFLCCLFALLGAGCAGNNSNFFNNLKEQYENGDISEEEFLQKRQEALSVPLYGSKVLYRPDDYNWSENVGEGNENYYEQYAWWLLRELSVRYAFLDLTDPLLHVGTDDADPALTPPGNEEIIGYYDSMRYQMQSYDLITLQKVEIKDDNSKETLATTRPYYEITANTSKGWNWSVGGQIKSFDEDASGTVTNQAFLYATDYFVSIPGRNDTLQFNNTEYPNIDEYPLIDLNKHTIANLNNSINGVTELGTAQGRFYTGTENSYSQAYLGTDYNANTSGNLTRQDYSDYVKAMEYAIYCINLDLVPNNITVTYDAKTGMPIVKVDRYDAVGQPGNENYKSSATVALEDIQNLFKQIGTYVGVTDRQQVRLTNWILNNVIGPNSSSDFDITSTARTLVQYVKKVEKDVDIGGGKTEKQTVEVLCDENGVEVNEFSPKETTSTKGETIHVHRDYEETVSTIVNLCTTQVQIGNSNTEGGKPNDDDPHINDRYPASNIVDYWGNDFFLSADNIFPNETESLTASGMKCGPLEYQSVALMFNSNFSFSNIWLGFKYDAGMDGDEVYDANKSLVIKVHVNLYTNKDDNYRKGYVYQNKTYYDSFQIEVKDGPFYYGEANSSLMLNALCDMRDGKYGYGGYPIEVGAFKPENYTILQSLPDYSGKYSIGRPLPLNGNDARRNYYQLVDGESDENKYYSYGILNPKMFAGDKGCDYVEIAYEIVKVKGDNNTNYKFYTGILFVA